MNHGSFSITLVYICIRQGFHWLHGVAAEHDFDRSDDVTATLTTYLFTTVDKLMLHQSMVLTDLMTLLSH